MAVCWAQAVRFAIGILAAAAAVTMFLAVETRWLAWLAAVAVFVVGESLAEVAFRRVASADPIRADLEDRVRSPP